MVTLMTMQSIIPVRYSKVMLHIKLKSTSLRVVVGQRFFVPVVGQLVFVENGRDDDRISNYAFI